MRKRRWEQRWWDFRVPLYHPFRDVSPEYQVAQASNYAMAHPIFTLRIRLPSSTPSACSFVGCTCPLSKAQLRSADLSFCIAWQAGSQSVGGNQLGEDPLGEGRRRACPRGSLGSAAPQKGGMQQARGRYYISQKINIYIIYIYIIYIYKYIYICKYIVYL